MKLIHARLLAVVTAAFSLSACAQNVWIRPGASTQEFDAERYACERDARQSGGFGSGLVGAMEAQAFFNRCMTSRGWRLQEREAAQASVASARSSVQEAIQQRRVCISSVRANPQYAPIADRFSDIQTGRFSFRQMANADIPTPQDAALMTHYLSEARPCVESYMSTIASQLPPAQMQLLRSNTSEGDALSAQLVRRQLSWGEHATRVNQLFDNNSTRDQQQSRR
ncbi:hypothetical protein [Falsiroseomonas sp.]|uniref:hypothetical protein n=1 Tax=Falsiroseomonas sp. TaxID=2870721 RepID=UPI003F6FAC39